MFEDYTEKHLARVNRVKSELALPENQDEYKQFQIKRDMGLGGSDMASLMGTGSYASNTPYHLWEVKTGRVPPFKGNIATSVGHWLEDWVAQQYAYVTGKDVRMTSSFLADKERPFLMANFDRLIVNEDGKIIGGLECKTAGQNHKVCVDGVYRDAWDHPNEYENGQCVVESDLINPEYYAQVQFYLAISKLPSWDVAVLISNNDFRIYTVRPNEKFISLMLDTAEKFWCLNVLDDMPPSKSYNDKVIDMRNEGEIKASEELLSISEQYRKLQADLATLESSKKDLLEQISSLLGDKQKAYYIDAKGKKKTLCAFQSTTRTGFDTKALQAKYPDIYNEFRKDVKTTAFIRVY